VISKDGNSFGMIVLFILICRICVYNFYMLYLLSSPYLLVFDDNRVRGTREQMMLMQVVLVRLSHKIEEINSLINADGGI